MSLGRGASLNGFIPSPATTRGIRRSPAPRSISTRTRSSTSSAPALPHPDFARRPVSGIDHRHSLYCRERLSLREHPLHRLWQRERSRPYARSPQCSDRGLSAPGNGDRHVLVVDAITAGCTSSTIPTRSRMEAGKPTQPRSGIFSMTNSVPTPGLPPTLPACPSFPDLAATTKSPAAKSSMPCASRCNTAAKHSRPMFQCLWALFSLTALSQRDNLV